MSPADERRAVAAQLLALVETGLKAASPEWDRHDDTERLANVALNGIRAVIGAAMATQTTPQGRAALAVALAPRLGNPLGQMMVGLPPVHVAACLEGLTEIMGQTLGADCRLDVRVHDASPSKPQLKVVQ